MFCSIFIHGCWPHFFFWEGCVQILGPHIWWSKGNDFHSSIPTSVSLIIFQSFFQEIFSKIFNPVHYFHSNSNCNNFACAKPFQFYVIKSFMTICILWFCLRTPPISIVVKGISFLDSLICLSYDLFYADHVSIWVVITWNELLVSLIFAELLSRFPSNFCHMWSLTPSRRWCLLFYWTLCYILLFLVLVVSP